MVALGTLEPYSDWWLGGWVFDFIQWGWEFRYHLSLALKARNFSIPETREIAWQLLQLFYFRSFYDWTFILSPKTFSNPQIEQPDLQTCIPPLGSGCLTNCGHVVCAAQTVPMCVKMVDWVRSDQYPDLTQVSGGLYHHDLAATA